MLFDPLPRAFYYKALCAVVIKRPSLRFVIYVRPPSLRVLDFLAQDTHSLCVNISIKKCFGILFIDSPYQVALAKRPSKKFPIDGPWLNSGVIKCLGNYANATRYKDKLCGAVFNFS